MFNSSGSYLNSVNVLLIIIYALRFWVSTHRARSIVSKL